MNVTVIGAGSIGQAVAGIAAAGGRSVQVLARDADKAAAAAQATGAVSGTIGDAVTGDVVVLALPYPALAEVLGVYAGALSGKILVDVSNPLDFSTFDRLVVPADGSAAAVVQALVPEARVVKAFNTTFSATLATGRLGDAPASVLIAGDDAETKAAVAAMVEGGGLVAVDAGSLKRARELEALGFLQLTLAATEKISWAGGLALVK